MPTYNGDAGNNTLTGSAGDDAIYGLAGNDSLSGGDGNDQIFGGPGNDTMDGGAGVLDYVRYDQATGSGVYVNLGTGQANGPDGLDQFTNFEGVVGSAAGDTLVGSAGNDYIEGGGGNDELDGGAGTDYLGHTQAPSAVTVSLATGKTSGGAGSDDIKNFENVGGSSYNDSLTGDGSFNVLEGMLGDDTLDGGGGGDGASYFHAGGAVTVNLTTGRSSGADGNDVLINIRDIYGSQYSDSLTGDSANNTITAYGGNDTIDGGAGSDTLFYSGNRADYAVAFNVATATFTITDKTTSRDGADQVVNVENFRFADGNATAAQLQASVVPDNTAPTLTGTSPADGSTGVALNGAITFTFSEAIALGNGSIQLRNSDGAVLASYTSASTANLTVSGNQLTLRFGSTLSPSSSYSIYIAGDAVRDLAGNYLAADGSYDFTTVGNGSVQVGDNQDNVLTASPNGDTLQGLAGNDTLNGGAGDDVLDGGSGNDVLAGGAGGDILIGGTGADSMQGGDGADLYYVDNAGDQVLEFQGNAAQPLAGDGAGAQPDAGRAVDKVIASISYTLTSFVENLALASASGNLSGSGNELNNVLTGNEFNNLLNGKAGNDTLDGGAGTDTAQYSGKLADYKLTLGASGSASATTTVADNRAANLSEGTDSLASVERLQFADVKLALDLAPTQAAGKALLAMAATLGNGFPLQKDWAGIFLAFFDSGASLLDGTSLLVDSGIMAAIAGGTDNASFVKLVYANVYGQAPDAATLATQVAALNNHSTTQAAWMADLAASATAQAHVNLAGYQQSGWQFI